MIFIHVECSLRTTHRESILETCLRAIGFPPPLRPSNAQRYAEKRHFWRTAKLSGPVEYCRSPILYIVRTYPEEIVGEPLRSWNWQQGGVITFPPKMESTLSTRIPSYRKTRLPRRNSRAAAASPAHAAAAPASECWYWMSPATYPIFLGSLSPASRTVHYARNHSQGIINV